jgi:hypothetical protein
MSTLTLPANPMNATFTGDIDVLDALVASNGNGTIYVRNGGLYVEGLTDLDQTTISTNDGEFNVNGTNKVNINVSGGATSSVEITAEDASFYTTTAGLLTLSATATDANGKVAISAAGTGTNSVLVEATNATSGQVTIQSAGASTSTDAVRILASDTTDGNILIQGAGNDTAGNPAIKLDATNATSGRISITSAGDSGSSNAVEILATGATDGNVFIQGAGTTDAVKIQASNASGQVTINSDGTGTNAINITTDGGTLVDATGRVYIQSADTTNGVRIATATAAVPVTIGTTTSLTTIAGNLTVEGTFTTINTESLSVEDNCILLNSGSGEAGIDSGVVMRRYQVPNDTGAGDVVSNPNPIQESGAFQAGSATPGTLVLGAHASDTTDFYKGWWIKITSGTGVDQVRRIKSYNATSKTATLYVTADNTVQFLDGLDLATAPAAADTYNLYSRPFMASFYGEASDRITLAALANQPDEISAVGVSTAAVQQYQTLSSGAHYVHTQLYNNALVSASGTTLTITLRAHGEIVGNRVRLTNSADLTPALANGIYVITTVPDANTFTVEAAASTTSAAGSSISVTSLHSSALYVNTIQSIDPYFPIQIQGLSLTENIIIPKTSTANFTVNISALYGTYIMHVNDIVSGGATAIFALSSSGVGGSVTRIASSKGADDQRMDAIWTSGQKIQIRHRPGGSGGGNYTYLVKLLPGL